ncbi:MAG: hypothetical protein M3367_11780 [Acidobacteriota bacterium]|nr:hypothetical protein [Acidobacteriota bacterium]
MSRSKRKNRNKQRKLTRPNLTTSDKDNSLQTESRKKVQLISAIEKQNPQSALSILKFVWASIKRTSLLVWTIIAGISVIVGIIGGVQLSPRVSVSSNESLDPSTPFSSPFIVSNEGLLPIYDVEFQCDIKNVEAMNNINLGGFNTVGTAKIIPIINPAGKETTQCAQGLFAPTSGQFENADVSIVVSYRVYWIPLSQTRKFRFVTRKDKSGQLHWFPKAIVE